MLFKVSSFHVYSHEDSPADNDIESCLVCELAIENQNSDFVFPAKEALSTPIVKFNIQKELPKYKEVIPSSFLRFSFFGRPPPTVV